MNLRRLRYSPPWRVTRWGFLRPLHGIGCDEWHNKSRWLVVPLVGWFVVFDKGYSIEGPEHLFAKGPEGFEGKFVATCDICVEVLHWFTTGE